MKPLCIVIATNRSSFSLVNCSVGVVVSVILCYNIVFFSSCGDTKICGALNSCVEQDLSGCLVDLTMTKYFLFT